VGKVFGSAGYRRLVSKARRGDATASDTLMRRLLPIIRGMARKIKCPLFSRRDGVQDACVDVLKCLPNVNLRRSEPEIKGFLTRVAYNRIVKCVRASVAAIRRPREMENADNYPAPEPRDPTVHPGSHGRAVIRWLVEWMDGHAKIGPDAYRAFARGRGCTVKDARRRLDSAMERYRLAVQFPRDPHAGRIRTTVERRAREYVNLAAVEVRQ